MKRATGLLLKSNFCSSKYNDVPTWLNRTRFT